ncbi:MAG: DNA alkylation repair protein [Thermodesulfobacteriota bacterium]
MSDKIQPVLSKFNSKKFVNMVSKGVNNLELKARVEVITDALREFLPKNYKSAVNILLKILGPENTNETGMFKEYYWLMPVALFVEKYGIDDFDTSVNAIYEITKRNTGEYAIRPFLKKYPDKTLKIMIKWSKDKNVHVRRLASEGVRPRLPWSQKLDQFIEDPSPIIPILENLKEDKSMFVKKSVANNLNDILKDNHEIGIKLLSEWNKTINPDTKWVIKHALRNEIKKENPEALKLTK